MVGTIKIIDETSYLDSSEANSLIDAAFTAKSTDNLSEGSSNLYYTAARADSDAKNAISGGTGVTVTNGEIAIGQAVGTTDSVTFSGLTVSGDLVVTGNTVEAQVTNRNIEDKYILLNSGSTSGDSGIVFGGADGVANSGVGLFWDTSYNSNDGRLGIVNSIAAGATGDQTPSYHIAGVYEGTEANAATAQADHVGNIRVESGEIYIYV